MPPTLTCEELIEAAKNFFKDRNRGTAELLRVLGLPAYYAMEAYVVLEGGQRLAVPPVPTASLGEGV